MGPVTSENAQSLAKVKYWKAILAFNLHDDLETPTKMLKKVLKMCRDMKIQDLFLKGKEIMKNKAEIIHLENNPVLRN